MDDGADDHITKTFGLDELLARLRAVARSGQTAQDDPVVVTGDLTVDLAAYKVLRAGDEECRNFSRLDYRC